MNRNLNQRSWKLQGLTSLNLGDDSDPLSALIGGISNLFGGGGGGSSSSNNSTNTNNNILQGGATYNAGNVQVPSNSINLPAQIADTSANSSANGGGGGLLGLLTGGGSGGSASSSANTNQNENVAQSNPFNNQNQYTLALGSTYQPINSPPLPIQQVPQYQTPAALAGPQSYRGGSVNVQKTPVDTFADMVRGGPAAGAGFLGAALPQSQPSGAPTQAQPGQQTDLSGAISSMLNGRSPLPPTNAPSANPMQNYAPDQLIASNAQPKLSLPPPPNTPSFFASSPGVLDYTNASPYPPVAPARTPELSNEDKQAQLETAAEQLGGEGLQVSAKLHEAQKQLKETLDSEFKPKFEEVEKHRKKTEGHLDTLADAAFAEHDARAQEAFEDQAARRAFASLADVDQYGRRVPSVQQRAIQWLRDENDPRNPYAGYQKYIPQFMPQQMQQASALQRVGNFLDEVGARARRAQGIPEPYRGSPTQQQELYRAALQKAREQAIAHYNGLLSSAKEYEKDYQARKKEILNEMLHGNLSGADRATQLAIAKEEATEAHQREEELRKEYDARLKRENANLIAEHADMLKGISAGLRAVGQSGRLVGQAARLGQGERKIKQAQEGLGLRREQLDASKELHKGDRAKEKIAADKEKRLEGIDPETGAPIRGKSVDADDYQKQLLKYIRVGQITRQQANAAMRKYAPDYIAPKQ